MTATQFSRRKALQLAGMGALGTIVRLSVPQRVFAWSSVVMVNTHAAIDTQAYAAMEKLPFFKEIPFPTLPDILAMDGSDALFANGKGPDVGGTSRYRQHYYNPSLPTLKLK